MLRRRSASSRSERAVVGLWLAATMIALGTLAPHHAAACSRPCGEDVVPRLRMVGTTVVPSELPANGWIYWRSSLVGADLGVAPDAVTIIDTRDGSLVPYDATPDTALQAWVLAPTAALIEGVTYEVHADFCGGEPRRILATARGRSCAQTQSLLIKGS